jgi:hypothetical protein
MTAADASGSKKRTKVFIFAQHEQTRENKRWTSSEKVDTRDDMDIRDIVACDRQDNYLVSVQVGV